MFDFLKEKMPSELNCFDVPTVAISDVVNGILDLNRYSRKFNCKWMKERAGQNLAALIECRDLFGLIEILPNWGYDVPLVLSIHNCPNFIGEKLPKKLKILNVIDCDNFSARMIPDMEIGVLNMSGCKMVNILEQELPRKLGKLVVYKNSAFNNISSWQLGEYLDALSRRMIAKGFDVDEGDSWVEYTNPNESKMYQVF